MNGQGIAVTAVIPTRNRPKELERLLRSLDDQQFRLDEVIVVDSSDSSYSSDFFAPFQHIPLQIIRSSPSVCRQRNIGIRNAKSEFVFLCDDDMEVPSGYLSMLCNFLRDHPEHSIVSGLVAERGADGMFHDSPPLSARRLVWNFLFLLGAWGDLRTIRSSPLDRWIVGAVKNWFPRKGNSETLAGWPLVMWMGEPYFTTKFYGLGASVVRRRLLLDSPYDETLDASGIGDHYGVALGLPRGNVIAVVTSARCYHHHALSQRLPPSEIYYHRILALDYFQQGISRHRLVKRAALLWSLIGNLLPFMLRRKWAFAAATIRAAMTIVATHNPHQKAILTRASGTQSEMGEDTQ